jgi:tRNA threonylcarbamoyladenosine biosynthesis protein TsaE
MKDIGKRIATELKGGDILALHGDLGAGKTTLMKGIAAGLGVKQEITSPTFTLMNIYNVKTLKRESIKTLIHIDTYRLKDEKELIAIGAEDFLGASDTICVIEWPEKILGLLRGRAIMDVTLEHVSQNERRVTYENIAKTA